MLFICLYLRLECCSVVLITINLILPHPYIFIIMNLTPFQYPICKSPPRLSQHNWKSIKVNIIKREIRLKNILYLVLRATHPIIIDINQINIIIREIRWAYSVVPFGFEDCKLLLCGLVWYLMIHVLSFLLCPLGDKKFPLQSQNFV